MTNKTKAERLERFARLLREARLAVIDPVTKEPLEMKKAAKLAGISRVQWSRYENEASGINPTTIPDIARALNLGKEPTEQQINEVYRWAGFYIEDDDDQVRLPASMRHFIELPIEIQRDIAKMVEREFERLQLKKEKRGRR